MAAVVNARDVLLQAAPTRTTVFPESSILLSASTNAFHVANGGAFDPASIAIRAIPIALDGLVTFVPSGCTLTAVSGNNATLTYANMPGATASITATITLGGVTITSNVLTLTKVLDGAPGSAGVSGTSVYVGTIYKQQAGAPAAPTGGTFNFGTTALTPPAGWTVAQPASTTTPTWAAEYTFSTATPGATVTAGAWSSPVVDAVNGAAGGDGVNGSSVLTLEVYLQSGSAPASPTAGAGSYTFSTDTFSNTGMTSWSRALPASSTTPTYRSAYTFSTTTPGVAVSGGAWSAPVVVAKNGVDGAPGAAGLNNALVYAYQRAASAPAGSPGAVDYDFTTKTITTVTLANGWQKTIPAGSNPLYVTVATASSTASTDNIGAGEWSGAVVLASDGTNGANGSNGSNGTNGLSSASVFIYQRNSTGTAPTLPSVTTTYTFATGALTGLNNGWTAAVPAIGSGAYLFVSVATAAATTTTDTIAAAEWATPSIMAQNGANGTNGSNGLDGARGPGTFYAAGSAWLDATADAATPGANVTDDVVTIYNGSGFAQSRRWNGSSWGIISSVFSSSMITDLAAAKLTGTITSTQIGDDSISTPKLQTGAVIANKIAADAVTAGKIAANAITAREIAVDSITATRVVIANRDSVDPDPGFYDALFWYPTSGGGWPTGTNPAENATYPTTRMLNIAGGATLSIASRAFKTERSASYRFKVNLYKVAGTAGNFGFNLHIPGVIYHPMGISRNATAVTYGAAIDWPSIPDNTFVQYTGVVTAGAIYDYMQFMQSGSITAGGILISIELVRCNDASLIVDGAVTADKIQANAVTAAKIQAGAVTTDKLLVTSKGDCISDDPYFEDVQSCWTLANPGTVLASGTAALNASCSRYFSNSTSISNARVYSTRKYGIDPAKTYNLTANLYVGPGNNREMLIYINFFDNAGAPISGTGWGGTMSGYVYEGNPTPSQFTNLGGQFGVGTSRAIPANARTAEIGVWFQYSGVGSGVVEQACQDIRLERVNGSTLIQDGAITTNKILAGAVTADRITTSSLSALSTNFGTVDIAAGGYLRSGQSAFNTGTGFFIGSVGGVPKFSIGTAGGARMTWDGSILSIVGETKDPFYVTLGGITAGSYGPYTNGTTQTIGTKTSSVTGGTGPYTYNWTVTSEGYDGLPATCYASGGTTGSSITVKASGTNMWQNPGFTLVVTDANGRTCTASAATLVKFGSYTP